MSERKAINKYYPPDFDPSKVGKKQKKVKTGSASLPTVRLMTPFSLKCLNCEEYISKSRKFNARKETTNETYLGMKTIKFHIKCPRCASEIIFRTDYKSADYVLEFGAKRNYENSATTQHQLKQETMEETLARLEREEKEEREEALKSEQKRTTVEELEEKLNDIRQQQDAQERIEDLQERNARLEAAKVLLSQKENDTEKASRLEDIDDEKLAAQAFAEAKIPLETTNLVVATTTSAPKLRPNFITKKKKVSKLGIRLKK